MSSSVNQVIHFFYTLLFGGGIIVFFCNAKLNSPFLLWLRKLVANSLSRKFQMEIGNSDGTATFNNSSTSATWTRNTVTTINIQLPLSLSEILYGIFPVLLQKRECRCPVVTNYKWKNLTYFFLLLQMAAIFLRAAFFLIFGS